MNEREKRLWFRVVRQAWVLHAAGRVRYAESLLVRWEWWRRGQLGQAS